MARKKLKQKSTIKEGNPKIKLSIYLIFLILIVIAFRINAPWYYEKATLGRFDFYSDQGSIVKGIKFDNCQISPVDNALVENSLVYFSCPSDYLTYLPKSSTTYYAVSLGNTYTKNLYPFEESFLENEYPDYLIRFPFIISQLGKSWIHNINITSGTSSLNEVKPTPGGHFKGDKRTFIIEYHEYPDLHQYAFQASSLLARTSFEKWEATYFYSSHGLFFSNDKGLDERLLYNSPSKLIIEFEIPISYEIVNPDRYIITTDKRGEKLGKSRIVVAEILPDKPFHLEVIDNKKRLQKIIINFLVISFILGFLWNKVTKKIGL